MELHLVAQAFHNALNTQLSKLMLHLNWKQKEQGGREETLGVIPVVMTPTTHRRHNVLNCILHIKLITQFSFNSKINIHPYTTM